LPEIYSVYNYGPKGNIRVIATIKTPQHLEEIKDQIKQQFSVLSLKTTIWTDVKEMHSNLSLEPNESNTATKESENTMQKISKDAQEVRIDEIDLKIADKLSNNGCASYRKIGQEIGLSTETVKKRYEKLKNNGILKVTTQLDFTKIGYQALSIFFITITTQEKSLPIIEKISKIPDVISIMKTLGDYDLQVYILIRDIDQLIKVHEEIGNIQGITKIDIETIKMPSKWPSPRQYLSTF
jgi:Lrp/AsnC family transcriptional regulator for asnA, asnC and gidA